MGHMLKDPSLALNEIVELLSAYSRSNSRQNYVKLLNSLEHVTIALKEETEQKQKRQKKKHTEVRFNRGAANALKNDLSNVATRSRGHITMNYLTPLTLRSHPKPEPLGVSEEAKHQSVSDQNPNINGRLSVFNSPSQETTVFHKTFTPKEADAVPAMANIEIPIGDKLGQTIKYCRDLYRGQSFIVNCDEYSETVNPNEIDDFFSHFQEEEWLTNFNLMPLIFSLNWPSTTLVLHSSYISLIKIKNDNQKSNRRRWPLDRNHDRVILPCCFQSHWTLFDVDLTRNSIRQYDSLGGDILKSPEALPAIKERLAQAMEGWECQDRHYTISSGSSQQQRNSSDCGIFMIYNADCLASNRDTLMEQIDGVQLRYRYLKRLLELERQGKSERQILDMVLPLNKTLRIKRRRIPGDISDDESGQNQPESKKSRRVDWMPPSHLGPEDAWVKERDGLATIRYKHGHEEIVPKHRERAEELLRMIEGIGCEEVMMAWDDTIAQEKSHVKLETPKVDSTAKAICQLVERVQTRSFKDKVLLRIGKWIFTMKILQDVAKFRKEGAPSKQSGFKPEADGKGNAVTRALTIFMKEAHPELQKPHLTKQRELEYCKYRTWWGEGQIWVLLCNAFGAAILLLVPGGHRIKDGHSISNRQFVEIKSKEREPFIEALLKLRPELKKTVSELDDQLEILKNDIADLLGRLLLKNISGEPIRE